MWRLLTQLWTVTYLAFLILNFFAQNKYEYLASPFSALYVGILALFVGTKEFSRWYEGQENNRHGEWFVATFSVIVFFLVGGALVLGERYRVQTDVAATYIAVLTIFAISRQSKELHKKKKRMR